MRAISRVFGLSAILGLAAGVANATPMAGDYDQYTDYDQSWTIADTSDNNKTNVSGDVFWDIVCDSDGCFFVFAIENTTPIPNADTRITGFAWNFATGITAVGASGLNGSSLNWDFVFGSGTLPGEAGSFDVCTFPQKNNPNVDGCGAGANTGIEVGDAINFFYTQVNLSGLTAAEAITAMLTPPRACLRVISIPESGPGSGNGSGSDVACFGDYTPPDDLPEPGTLALFGLGLAGLGLGFRRRKA